MTALMRYQLQESVRELGISEGRESVDWVPNVSGHMDLPHPILLVFAHPKKGILGAYISTGS